MIKTKAELEREYDKIYDEVCNFLSHRDPCFVVGGECLAYRLGFYKTNFCCNGCRHLTRYGCKAKSLACKLWLCPPAMQNMTHGDREALRQMRRYAESLHFCVFRGCKKESLVYADYKQRIIAHRRKRNVQSVHLSGGIRQPNA